MEKLVLSLLLIPLTLGMMCIQQFTVRSILKCLALALLVVGLLGLYDHFVGFEEFTFPELGLIFCFGLAPLLLSLMSRAIGITKDYSFAQLGMYDSLKNVLFNYVFYIGCAFYQLLMIWTNILKSMNV